MGDLPVNGARGEAALRIGSVDLVIAAEIGRLAAVSTALECKSFIDLYQRLLGVEIAATMAGIQHLTVRGNAAAAIAQMRLKDLPACKAAFAATLSHHLGDDEGKGGAAGKAARRKKPSPGATG
jgi:hypothetical protein